VNLLVSRLLLYAFSSGIKVKRVEGGAEA